MQDLVGRERDHVGDGPHECVACYSVSGENRTCVCGVLVTGEREGQSGCVFLIDVGGFCVDDCVDCVCVE